jgi:hypothetical protein
MEEEQRIECKFLPNYNRRVLVSAKCACGVRFDPPKGDAVAREKFFRDQYDEHRKARYARPNLG